VRNRFDQLGKSIGLSALGPSGPTVAHEEITPDAHHADLRHDPDPTRAAERARLGLLGRMVSVTCLIELFSGTPGEDEVLACLAKLIAFRQKRRREAARQRAAPPVSRPFLWIVSAGRPVGLLSAIAAVPAAEWPRGVYRSPGVLLDPRGAPLRGPDAAGGLLRAGIVAASELPRDRSTLLVRLMVAGPLLAAAIDDLSELPDDAHERVVAEQILLDLRHVLGTLPTRTPDEEEFIVQMMTSWREARIEGRLEGRATALLTVLRVRGLAVSDADRAQILAEQDLARLERWLEKAVVATSLAEVMSEPS
jgi:hypothetical protein